jgi:hypothetical protein
LPGTPSAEAYDDRPLLAGVFQNAGSSAMSSLKLLLCTCVASLLVSSPLQAQPVEARAVDRTRKQTSAKLLPPNSLGEPRFVPAPDDAEQRRIFNALIDEIVRPYVEIVEKNEIFMDNYLNRGTLYPVKFIIDDASKDWENTLVNADAPQTIEPGMGIAIWTIRMFGGLFRRPEVTKDGFALFVCHEIGHHFGGYPFKTIPISGSPIHLSAEGNADYFATHSCLRHLWKLNDNSPPYDGPYGTRIEAGKIPAMVKVLCDVQWSAQADVQLCHRIAIAGLSAGMLLGSGAKDRKDCETPEKPNPCYPDLYRPDRTRVEETAFNGYPRVQCRFDTYFAGALCTTEFGPSHKDKIIPGKFGHIPENTARARDETLLRSCAEKTGGGFGARPRCWFNPADVR